MLERHPIFQSLAVSLIWIAATHPALAQETLTARNKSLVQDFYTTVFIGRNVDAAPRFLAPDYIQHSANIPTGPDYKREILRIVGEDNIVLVFNRQSGTHPDGKHEVLLQFDMFRVENGLIVEHWDADT